MPSQSDSEPIVTRRGAGYAGSGTERPTTPPPKPPDVGHALARAERQDCTRDDRIAAAFHDAYERRAPQFGYKTRDASAVAWEDVPDDNKRLMRAVVRELLERGVIHA